MIGKGKGGEVFSGEPQKLIQTCLKRYMLLGHADMSQTICVFYKYIN